MSHRLVEVPLKALAAFGVVFSLPVHAGPLDNFADMHGPLTAIQAGAAVDQGYSGLLQSIPALDWTTPEAVESMWRDVKGIKNPAQQLRALEERGVYHQACRGLVDLRRVHRQRDPDASPRVAFRDNHRGRSWLQPHVAAVLETALDHLGRKHRNPRTSPLIVFGDAAQPGCGQLEYGSLVEMVSDSVESLAATELLNRAVLRNGVPTVRTEQLSAGRIQSVTETVLIGHGFDASGRLTLRTRTRHFQRASRQKTTHDLRLLARVEALFSTGHVAQRRVTSWDPQRRMNVTRWRTTHIGPKWQSVTLSRRPLVAATPLSEQRGLIVEMRLSERIRLKPGSLKNEIRWVNTGGPKTSWGSGWRRWDLIHEAGHQTHVAGRDIDVAYVTTDDQHVFTRAPDKLDVTRTWEWFTSLDLAARRHGTRLERILVGPRVHRILRRTLEPNALGSRLFKNTVRAVRGHDGHHHVRFSRALSNDAPLTQRLLRPLTLIYAELFQNR